MINKADVTFVVTGKVIERGNYTTAKCLQSIRRYYKGATIILVVWDDDKEAANGLEYDLLLTVHDDDTVNYSYYLDGINDADKRVNSVNRQQKLVSMGGKHSPTKYVARVRTDFIFTNDNMLNFYEKWSNALAARERNLAVFHERVLAYMVNMVNPHLHDGHFSYQLSDCFLFGRREDILYIFDGHREKEEDLNYFAANKESDWTNPYGFRHKFTNEQFLCLNVIRKSGLKLSLPCWCCDTDESYERDSERFFASNLIIGNSNQLGFSSKFRDCFYQRHYELDYLLQCYTKYVQDTQLIREYLKESHIRQYRKAFDRVIYIVKERICRTERKIKGFLQNHGEVHDENK